MTLTRQQRYERSDKGKARTRRHQQTTRCKLRRHFYYLYVLKKRKESHEPVSR